MDHLNEKNVLVIMVTTIIMFVALVAGITVGSIKVAASGDAYRTKVATACIQSGGDWQERTGDCIRR